MSRKGSISIFVVIIASLLVSSIAQAQSEQPMQGGRRGIGKVFSIGEGQFTMETRQGEQRSMLVDDKTQYRTSDGQIRSFDDLQVGQWVVGIARFNQQGQLVARLVIILPDGYDPSQRLGRRARGYVTEVDLKGGSFNLLTLSGEKITFRVAEGTIYLGSVHSLSDLHGGMRAAVGAIKQEDGSLTALVVLVRFPFQWHIGKVTSVDLANNQFTLQTRLGGELSFKVDGNTRFRGSGGAIQSLDDLQPGMPALVAAKEGEGSELAAVLVAAGRRPLP